MAEAEGDDEYYANAGVYNEDADNQQEETLADLIFNAEISENPEDVTDTEEKATIEELASVLLNPEEIPKGSPRTFARNLYKSFRSCQAFMSTLCRFPIVSRENADHSIEFEYNWSSLRGNLFFITFSILTLLTLLSTFNVISIMLNFPQQPDNITAHWNVYADENGIIQYTTYFSVIGVPNILPTGQPQEFVKDQDLLRAEEMFIFRRNFASLVIVMFLMYHILTSDWNLYSRRHFVASYLTFWTESVEIMKIDAAGEAKRFVKKFLMYYTIWFMVFCLSLVINIAPVASGAPVSFFFIWARTFNPAIHAVDDKYISTFRSVGGFMYLYVVLCSKVYVFFFLYVCKILSTACTVWNERLEKVFTTEERSKDRKEKCASRTGYDHLFKDYVTLLDLISGADTLFTNIIESYFSVSIISIVFEVYYMVRPISESQTEFSNARRFDMLPVALYLFNSLVIFYLASTGAAEVGESAANGLEIIRRQGILGHRSDSEMHFMISLYMSFTGHFDTALSGGGYFILNKAFFVSIAGTLISYIIIIFQFQPSLGLDNIEQRNLIGVERDDRNFKILVMHVEKTFRYVKTSPPGY